MDILLCEYCYSPHRHFLFYCICDFTSAYNFAPVPVSEISEEENYQVKGGITDQWCDNCDQMIEDNRNHFMLIEVYAFSDL